MATLSGFITNLGLYNEGELVGEWICFPIDDDELEEVKKRIRIDETHEEWFFTDYECELNCFSIDELDEYESIERLNAIGEKLQKIEDEGLNDHVSAALEHGYSFDEAVEKALNGDIIFLCKDEYGLEESIARNYIDEIGGASNLSKEMIDRYFDFEAFGRDMTYEGSFVEIEDNIFEIL